MPNLSPATVAQRIREAGWEVDELTDPPRIRATRRTEKLTVTWDDGSKFVRARHWLDGEEDTTDYFLPSVGAVMAEIVKRPPRGLPFDPVDDDDEQILAAVAGRSIKWRNSITGQLDQGTVPRGGVHLKVRYTSAGRVLEFADPVVTGFRTVRVCAIEEVS